jgi:hypothetical protein
MAARDGTSLNQFLVAAVSERVGAASLYAHLLEQLQRQTRQATINSADNTLTPAAIVPVLKIGIQRFPEPNSLTVDAARVNPLDREAVDLPAPIEDQSPPA